MPVQINELVMRANISDTDEHNAGNAPAGDSADGEAIDKEEIIKECTERILEILKNKKER